MTSGKRHSTDLRQKVVKFQDEGLGYSRIVDKLLMEKETIPRIVQKYKNFGSVTNLPASGLHRITTARVDHDSIPKIKENSQVPAPKIILE